jgi:branched-chain amino acid transport system ATP-binding protein
MNIHLASILAAGTRTEAMNRSSPGGLQVQDVTVRFGGVTALEAVSLTAAPGRVTGIIGPNGAGKTTLLNAVCGFVRPEAGRLTFDGTSLARVRPHRLAGLGIARTLQGLGLFGRLPVLENVMVGADCHARAGFWTALIGLRKRVVFARALAARPRLLLLDEPASGLSEPELAELGGLITDVAADACVVVVEHRIDLMMSACDTIVVLDFGKVIATGPPARVLTDPAVTTAYLGATGDG